MVAGDPESDSTTSELINFLNFFDICAGTPCFFSPGAASDSGYAAQFAAYIAC